MEELDVHLVGYDSIVHMVWMSLNLWIVSLVYMNMSMIICYDCGK